jgi:hypothetical protein
VSSEYLTSYIENSAGLLKYRTPELLKTPTFKIADLLCFSFRQNGSCEFLLTGDSKVYFDSLHKSAGCYLYFLKNGDESEKRTSINTPFFDAITAGLYDGVMEMSKYARKTWNDDCEYEDDFLYTHFLLNYFFPQSEAINCEQILTDYETVLAGDSDTRFDLCKSFFEKDPELFNESFVRFLDERKQEVSEAIDRERIGEDEWSWTKYISVEGLALLKLAQLLNFKTGQNYLQIPELLRDPKPVAFKPDYWQSVSV